MISEFLELLGLKEKLPAPIGYNISEPIWFPFPDEINQNENIDNFAIVLFSINNLSDKELDNVRILYDGEFSYLPKIRFRRRNVDVDYEIDTLKKEFIINSIPPKEDLFIDIFIKENESIKIEEVLIDKKRINQYMQKYSEIKKYPLISLFYIISFISIIGTGYLVYTVKNALKEKEVLDKVVEEYRKDWKSYTLYIFDNKIENEKLLSREFNKLDEYEQNEVLKLNKVTNYEKLKAKDEIYLLKGP